MAAAWIDERHRGSSTSPAASAGRSGSEPTRRELFFASTEQALEIAEHYTGLRLRKRELAEGTLVALAGARAVRRERVHARPELRGATLSPPSARRTRARSASSASPRSSPR